MDVEAALPCNVTYDAFKPMAKMARVLGLFPFNNIGRFGKGDKGVKLVHQKSANSSIILFALAMLLKVAQLIAYVVLERLRGLGLYGIVTSLGWHAFNIFGSATILLHFLWNSEAFVAFFNRWLDQAPSLRPYEAKLRLISKYLLFANIFCSAILFFAVCVSSQEAIERQWYFWHLFIAFVYDFGSGATLCQQLYVVYFVVYFCYVLRYSFQVINRDLREILSPKHITERMSLDSLSLTEKDVHCLRQRHQDCCQLLEEMELLLSPILLMVILTNCVDVCMTVSIVVLKSVTSSMYTFLQAIICVPVRFVPITVLCLSGDKLLRESAAGLRIIHRSSLRSLSREDQFQVQLFESSLLAHPPQLSASGFLTIDNSLFMQIIGVIITYVVVMIQFGQTGPLYSSKY